MIHPFQQLLEMKASAVKQTLLFDVECYRNFFLIVFRRISDGKVVIFEKSERSTIDWRRVVRIMRNNTIVGFNSQSYDVPMIFFAATGKTNEQLKVASDQIIKRQVKYWEAEKFLKISIPYLDHIDLWDTNPSVMMGLKTLCGRLHGKRLQDLPYDPDVELTVEMMDDVIDYCANGDIPATGLLFDSLKEMLEMRVAIGATIDVDLRSKSDQQIGETVIKHRIRAMTGESVKRLDEFEDSFGYKPPSWLKFETKQLQDLLALVSRTRFEVGADAKPKFPPEFEGLQITIGPSTYTIGIGGLHSNEKRRALVSDDETVLIDADVASQYPRIIMKLGLYPKAVGPAFCPVYGAIMKDRLAAKEIGDRVREVGGKYALVGVYGKLGSPYSFLYAPHLMLAVTLTGQLSSLMLIEQAHARGVEVVSANTDGVVFRCPRAWFAGIGKEKHNKAKLLGGKLKEITDTWESQTDLVLEFTEYKAIYSRDVNCYIAVKEDGTAKRKGPIANPWGKGDLYEQMKKNPQMNICSDAVTNYLTKGEPIENTIRSNRDITGFVTLIRVNGGGTWKGKYLGKVVRYIWSTNGAPILYKEAHATTGNHKKVSRSDGCRPVMDLPDSFPEDIDYAKYIAEAHSILESIGYEHQTKTVYERFLERVM